MWLSGFPRTLGEFPAKCKYLEPQYLDLPKRVIDVGFLDRWWVMEAKLENCDINEDEWNADGSPKAPSNQLQKMW